MTTKQPKPDLRILISFKDEAAYGERTLTATASIVVITSDGVRNPSEYSDDGSAEYAGLTMIAHQYKSASSMSDDWLWDTEPRFERYGPLNQRDLEKMLKTLRRLNTRLGQSNLRLGYPQSYAEYLVRLSLAIGCKSTLCFGWARNPGAHTWNEADIYWEGPTGTRYHLDRVARQWREKHGFVEATA